MILLPLTHALVAHPPDSALPPLGWLLLVLSLGLGAVLAGVFAWGRALGRKLQGVEAALATSRSEHDALAAKDKERAKDLEAKRDELAKLKKDMATQRKKTHASQEEAKQLRGDLTAQKSAGERAKSARPAFEDAPPAPAPRPAPAAKSEPEAPAAPRDDAAEQQLRDRLHQLEERSAAHKQELDAAHNELAKNRSELRQARRKVEDYRRIDAVTVGRMAALEDRVANLGRQYYEACTEIAVLKGEVPRLPTPQEREAMRSLQESTASSDAEDEAPAANATRPEAGEQPEDDAQRAAAAAGTAPWSLD